MTGTNDRTRSSLTLALQAIGNLLLQELNDIFIRGQVDAQGAHAEIELAPIDHKSGAFYRYFLPFRKDLVSLLANSYRRYFKLALAHPRQAGLDHHHWACCQLQPAVGAALEQIRDWYVLACDGENQWVRYLGTMESRPGQTSSLPIPLTVPPFPPPESWRAPAWLFGISPLTGIGPLKSNHVPATDSEQKLGAAHTRLLLKGARRAFLWDLGAAIETVRNEEIAAAGAIPTEAGSRERRGPNKRKGWEQRERLHSAIRKALSANPGLQGMEFCAELDKRHALPLLDWTERGDWREGLTWKEAWGNPGLRRKIRRVRQEAQKVP